MSLEPAQYIITIVVFICLTAGTVMWSLLPWSREHHLSAWQEYRYCAIDALHEGRLNEGERFWRAALREASALDDRVKMNEGKEELEKILALSAEKSRTSLEAAKGKFCHEQGEAGNPYDNTVWPTSLEYLRVVRRNRSAKRWEPALKLLFRREKIAARNNPQHLIELGDALMEMARFEPSKAFYESAIQISTQQQSTHQQLEALDRKARACYSAREYGAARMILKQAIQLSESDAAHDSQTTFKLHEAQVLCDWGESLNEAKANCKTVLESLPQGKEPLLTWYARVLSADIDCRTYERKLIKPKSEEPVVPIGSTIEALKSIVQFAGSEFGPNSMQSMRSWETLGAAYAIAGNKEETRDAFAKFIAIKAQRTDDDPLVPREVGKEAKCFHQLGRGLVAIPLWEWVSEWRYKEDPKNIARANEPLRYVSETYKDLGTTQQALQLKRNSGAAEATPK